MSPTPCPICAYPKAPGTCPHCFDRWNGPSAQRSPVRGMAGLIEGARAPLVGASLLLRGPKLKRVLVPPVLAVTLGAAWLHGAWISPSIEAFFTLSSDPGPDPSWWQSSLAWLADSWLLQTLSGLSSLIALALTIWLSFTLLFEVIAGPFLDEIHSRLETQWFGRDPRSHSARPDVLGSEAATRCSLQWLLPGGLLGAAIAWFSPLLPWLLAPVGLLIPLLWVTRQDPSYLTWLRWAAGHELRLLMTSAKIALISILVLLIFIWLPFVPLVGTYLWISLSGFVLAMGLCDLAFSRRDWPGRSRMRFMMAQAPAFGAFGLVGGFLVGIPILGPILAVPALSIGSLWLICRLDTGQRAAS
ncbi:MAG TPA: EI24 domain-containing protein [Planctomycetes bacterium]|nr:EI24 domain-containing protein [Planctomycetota bacterium]HIL36541.1 EI24 domain-containing protein [Planctomycetota bacterium]